MEQVLAKALENGLPGAAAAGKQASSDGRRRRRPRVAVPDRRAASGR
jgi:hypothetical protein